MLFTIRVKDASHEWDETYDDSVKLGGPYKLDGDPEAWARRTVAWFNSGLREGELPRELVSVTILDDSPAPQLHDWRKTSLATVSGTHQYKGQCYDTYRCARCGVTGKKFGLGAQGVMRDRAFRAKKFEACVTKEVN